MKNNYFVILFILFVLSACNNKEQQKVLDCKTPSVIVFEQALGTMDFKTPFKNLRYTRMDSGVISYTVDNSIVFYNPSKTKDTLQLNNSNHYVELCFKPTFEDYYYLIAPNDTVQFSVDEYGRPTLKSNKSELLTTLYNFPYNVKSGVSYLCYRPLTGLFQFGYYLERLETAKTVLPSLFEKNKDEYVPIDTLQQSFLVYQKNYRRGLDSLKNFTDIPSQYINYLEYKYELDNYTFEMSKKECGQGLSEKFEAGTFFNDNYLTYPSYHNFLGNYLEKYFNYKEEIPILMQKMSRDVNWRKTYDKIIEKTYPTATKNIMLKFALEKMSLLFSVKDIQSYLDDYVERTGDKATVEAIVNPFDLTASEKELSSKSLLLKDMQGKVQTLEQVLEANKGYVLYVDFWASWCIPCRSLMPDSKKLHEKYVDKKVKFLYFSIDKDEKAWEKAVLKDKLEENSYLIVNTEKPAFVKEINLGPIPRYLVFDKNGKLVEKEAPRPNQGKIETIFDKYLKE